MTGGRGLLLILALALLAACSRAERDPRATPESTSSRRQLFELRSHLWVNLHQRLYAETSFPDPAAPQHGFDRLVDTEREAWDSARAVYRRQIPERDQVTPMSPELAALNHRLSTQGDALDLTAAGSDPDFAMYLETVAPVYRRHGWPDDDRSNRAWIDALLPALDQHGDAIARELVAAYDTPWPHEPIVVEVAVYAGKYGAYTTIRPPLVTIASAKPRYQGDAALETIFHEAGHLLVQRLQLAIVRECVAQDRPVPKTLWHALIFYTTGEIVRRRLPRYTPLAYQSGLYEHAPLEAYERLLSTYWRPYLDGEVDMYTAIRTLVANLAPSASTSVEP